MQEEVASQLLRVNREFYQTFANQFSETRERVQPGVRRLLRQVPSYAAVLDLGCGNGQVSHELHLSGHEGPYVGVDASRELIDLARSQSEHLNASFVAADLIDTTWVEGIPIGFDHAFAFALLHHLPGAERRARLLRQVREVLLDSAGLFLSTWNFMESSRLRERIVPWGTIGLREDQVDQGDYLLDWRRGGYGIRYVHLFDDSELTGLANVTGFAVINRFLSDGEDGKLGMYQVWERSEPD